MCNLDTRAFVVYCVSPCLLLHPSVAENIDKEIAQYPGPGQYKTEHSLGQAFRLAKHDCGGTVWLEPPSVGAGLFAGGATTGAGAFKVNEMTVLPKRHSRFVERFRAAKESRGAAGGSEDGVTSFGALLPDVVGRAD
jgi:hypothetical protein